MRKFIKIGLILTVIKFGTGCKGKENENCNIWYSKANSSLNDYYIDYEEAHLDHSMEIVERGYNVCPSLKSDFVNLKITLLLLRKEYERGYSFIDTLDEAGFEPSYKKNLYLKTFKALSLEKKGDLSGRNEHFKDLVQEIKDFISLNPSNKEAIADLFYTKLKYKDKEKVLKELDSWKASNFINDRDFLDALKESIRAAPNN